MQKVYFIQGAGRSGLELLTSLFDGADEILCLPFTLKIIDIWKKKIKKVNVFVATNFLESMVENAQPSRAEINDIYNSIEIGCNGLVLASETAIGKYPESCIKFIKKIIKVFKKQKSYKF